jgi:hypothetical protein
MPGLPNVLLGGDMFLLSAPFIAVGDVCCGGSILGTRGGSVLGGSGTLACVWDCVAAPGAKPNVGLDSCCPGVGFVWNAIGFALVSDSMYELPVPTGAPPFGVSDDDAVFFSDSTYELPTGVPAFGFMAEDDEALRVSK